MARQAKRSPRQRQSARPAAELPERVARLASRGQLREAIRRLVAGREAPADTDLDRECKRLFEQLRKTCPHLVPKAPLGSGELGPEIELDPKSAEALLSAAGQKVSDGAARVVWTLGDSELEVFPAKLSLATRNGELHVSVPVRCDQTGDATVSVVFVVGTEKRPAGLLATTNGQAAGPDEIVSIWSDALTAFAWGAVQELMQALAWESGGDRDRAGLIPAALAASPEGLRIQTMARHGIDRRPR